MGFGWITPALRERIAALRGDCELIKMADFIDPFDHEHSSSGVVLLRGETRRHRRSGAQYSLRHSATGRQRANRQTGGITRHEALSASALRALVHGDGALRVYP